eukprot:c27536_g1_i1 orf=735-2048(-)
MASSSDEGSESRMDSPVHKVAIAGATLTCIMQDFASSPGDCDGVLFGHVERMTAANLQDDDEQPGSREELTAFVTGFFCSGRMMSFYDATGRIDYTKLALVTGEREKRGGDPPIGWFVGRRNTPMRPSMREAAVSRYLRLGNPSSGGNSDQKSAGLSKIQPVSGREKRIPTRSGQADRVDTSVSRTSSPSGVVLRDDPSISQRTDFKVAAETRSPGVVPISKTTPRSPSKIDTRRGSPSGDATYANFVGIPPSSPSLFWVFTEISTQDGVHTHDYRAYQYSLKPRGGTSFDPRRVIIVNIGPAFRTHYDLFSPVAPFPLLASQLNHEDGGGFEADSWSPQGENRRIRPNLQGEGRSASSSLAKEQLLLDMYSEGYSVGRLVNLIGSNGMQRVPELEDLYARMLSKLESLAKQVCELSAALAEQEKVNARLRASFMGE